MTGHQAAALYAATYAPNVEELLKPLPDAGDAFAAMLVELTVDPTCERVARCLVRIEGIRQHLHRTHAALAGEGDGR